VGRRLRISPAEAREGEEYLGRFVANTEARLRWLRDEAAATGGPTPEQLDFSRESLVPLWSWAVGRFRPRPKDAPLDFIEEDDGARYYRPRDARLPMWYGRRLASPYLWSDETLDLIDAVIYYVAECLIRAAPGVHWEVFHSATPRHLHENQPLLLGLPQPVNPVLAVVMLMAGRYFQMLPDEPNPYRVPPSTPDDLRQWFDDVTGGPPRT
jgi:hypothetical protein